MSPARLIRWSRRTVMYALVGMQLGLLALIVVLHEANRVFDRGPAVDLEMSGARARKHPFRGASVNGRLALNLDGSDAAVTAEEFLGLVTLGVTRVKVRWEPFTSASAPVEQAEIDLD